MQVLKWTALAVAVSAVGTQMALADGQSESNGFVADSSLNLLNRNFYMNRDFRNNDGQSYVEEWSHGIVGKYESGFTQGPVGVGVDVIGMMGVKLDTGRGRAGAGALPLDADGRAEDDFSQLGGAVKVRVSNTTLKWGSQFSALPIFATDDSRLLPELAEGVLLNSTEMEGLVVNAGRFTSISAQNQSGRDTIPLGGDGGITAVSFLGGSYQFTERLGSSLYYAHTEDYFRKYYTNLNYNMPLSETQALMFDFNFYDTRSEGEERWGELDNRAWSFAAAYSVGAHTFTAVHQRISGTGNYEYGPDGFGTIWLANSVQTSDFNAEDEKSWQLRYDLNMAAYGVPGLSFLARYVRGTDANVATTDDGKEWERDFEAKYVVQSGPAKDLSLRLRQATYRSSDGVYYGAASRDDVRVIIEYPLNVF